ncbi:MAG: hypothetical protein FJ146_11205 [Deltaproteobacteria bacterium]|nr:hypothetical protein [Deltaproteobacteria bacterium]
MGSGVSTLGLVLLLPACAVGASAPEGVTTWSVAEDYREPQLPLTGYAESSGSSLATLECSRLAPVADGMIGSHCLVVDVAGEVLDLNRAAASWEWAVRAAPGCQPLENERRAFGSPTSFEIGFQGSSIDTCMKSSVVSVDVMPQSGGVYTLITQLE